MAKKRPWWKGCLIQALMLWGAAGLALVGGLVLFFTTDRVGSHDAAWFTGDGHAVVVHRPFGVLGTPNRARILRVSLAEGRALDVQEVRGRQLTFLRPPGEHFFVWAEPAAMTIHPLAEPGRSVDVGPALEAHQELSRGLEIRSLLPDAVVLRGRAGNNYAVLADGRIVLLERGPAFARPGELSPEQQEASILAHQAVGATRYRRERQEIRTTNSARTPGGTPLTVQGLFVERAGFATPGGEPLWIPQAEGALVVGLDPDDRSGSYRIARILAVGPERAVRWNASTRDLFGDTRLLGFMSGQGITIRLVDASLEGDELWVALEAMRWGRRDDHGDRSVYYDLRLVALDPATGELLRRIRLEDLLAASRPAP